MSTLNISPEENAMETLNIHKPTSDLAHQNHNQNNSDFINQIF